MSAWLAAGNILAVRLDNIGDVVMLGPALRAAKEAPPAARIIAWRSSNSRSTA